MQKEHFSGDSHEIKKHSISFLAANVFAFLYSLPFLLLFAILFIGAFMIKVATNQNLMLFQETDNTFVFMGLYIGILFILVILHEFLHALYFLPGCENRWKSIKFGFKYLTPFCHCDEILTVSQYRKSLFAPLWLICLPLSVLASITGSVLLILLALTMIVGSGGDLYIAYVLRKYPGKTTYVYDLVDEVGCQVYVPHTKKLRAEPETDTM